MRAIAYIVILFSVTFAKDADPCTVQKCKITANCWCSSVNSPLPNPSDGPQLIAITFDEAVVENLFTEVWKPLLFNRKNPNGQPISATFYVPHEYTDYTRVHDLYAQGFEIGVNSITKNALQSYWKTASEQILVQEFAGQREILHRFANIPLNDITGARTPQLMIEGDISFRAYVKSNLTYDNSWSTRTSQELFPYTLDYMSTQQCDVGKVCPRESHTGFWIAPITNIKGNGSIECNSLINCDMEGTADQLSAWLLREVNAIRTTSRVPISIILPSAWFAFTDNSHDAFVMFLDALAKMKDVFLVSQRQILDWMKNPVPLSKYSPTNPPRKSDCVGRLNCRFKHNNSDRYMMKCGSGCPQAYPWLGNPSGDNLS